MDQCFSLFLELLYNGNMAHVVVRLKQLRRQIKPNPYIKATYMLVKSVILKVMYRKTGLCPSAEF